MFNDILGRFSRRPTASRRYAPIGGGILLPILAFFGWKYRAQLRDLYRSRFGGGQADTTLHGIGNPLTH